VVDERARAALAAARRRLARATADMHEQAVASYIRGGPEDTIAAIMEALDDASSTGRTLSYADAVLDHQREVIIEFKAARAQNDRLSRAASSARGDATRARDDIAEVRTELAESKLRTQALADEVDRVYLIEQITLNELRARKLEIEARIISLEKESDGIAFILAGLQEGQPDYVPGSILFANPIPGTTVGSPFGMRFHPILHYTRLHAGADISVGSGTPIRAAADGVVVIAGDRGGYGNCVVIDHGSGLSTVYAHQSSMAVQPGQQVKVGDVIGLVGSTGLSTGPHLHFETRLRGIPVNPTNFITF
jgi:murein DD-endopeptidase MepM/ murein hydrolase activator NlpD